MSGISDCLSLLNSWVVDYKELIAVFGIPLLTLVVTNISGRRAEGRAREQQTIERKLAQELKLVEFRQAWINELRIELSEFVSLATMAENDFSDWGVLTHKLSKIKLMLNPEDDYATELLLQCGGLVKTMISEPERNTEIGDRLLILSQRLLKTEWERLKADLNQTEGSQ